ncbi:MAG: hypothetical protein A2W91_09830 [Bacteroidetes bacterium GWF2_38_335]|nr:MAG: hypothetical protein A2W91_09830 [Bacteroidetes bacterium GWF2_38_335]
MFTVNEKNIRSLFYFDNIYLLYKLLIIQMSLIKLEILKRLLLIIFAALFFSFDLDAKQVEGLIIYENDTVKVTFDIPVTMFKKKINFRKIQYRIKYLDSLGNKEVLKPRMAKGIIIKFEELNIKMISEKNSLTWWTFLVKNSNIFLKLELNGELKLYKYFLHPSSGTVYTPGSNQFLFVSYKDNGVRYVLKKGEGKLNRVWYVYYVIGMQDYFRDCPALVDALNTKYKSIEDIEFIVRFYNSQCK